MAGRGHMMNRLAPKQTRATVFLLAAISIAAANSGAAAESRPCRAMEYERSAYTICEVDLRQQTSPICQADSARTVQPSGDKAFY
jgi:hypothetical protein